MTKFKPGDRVIIREVSDCGIEHQPGDVFTILRHHYNDSHSCDYVDVMSARGTVHRGWYPRHFELAEPETGPW